MKDEEIQKVLNKIIFKGFVKMEDKENCKGLSEMNDKEKHKVSEKILFIFFKRFVKMRDKENHECSRNE